MTVSHGECPRRLHVVSTVLTGTGYGWPPRSVKVVVLLRWHRRSPAAESPFTPKAIQSVLVPGEVASIGTCRELANDTDSEGPARRAPCFERCPGLSRDRVPWFALVALRRGAVCSSDSWPAPNFRVSRTPEQGAASLSRVVRNETGRRRSRAPPPRLAMRPRPGTPPPPQRGSTDSCSLVGTSNQSRQGRNHPGADAVGLQHLPRLHRELNLGPGGQQDDLQVTFRLVEDVGAASNTFS